MNKRVEQFGALGQEDRLRIFRLLVRAGLKGKCVDEVKRALKMPGSTLSHHLDTLTRSGLCTAQRSGRFIYLRRELARDLEPDSLPDRGLLRGYAYPVDPARHKGSWRPERRMLR